jgi:hypothetical protein
MFGHQIIGFYMKSYQSRKHLNLLNNGFLQFIAVGKNKAQYMKNIEMISLVFEDKEENIKFKQDLDSQMD